MDVLLNVDGNPDATGLEANQNPSVRSIIELKGNSGIAYY